MRFFFPDSQDFVKPSFDFERESWLQTAVRQRSDLYAHEVFAVPPYDGLLISKGSVDAYGRSGRYSIAQRLRLLRTGAREFFRTERPSGERLLTMGDCGAFNYVEAPEPPHTVEEVIDFYESCGFDYGLAVDHIIFEYLRRPGREVSPEAKRRYLLTLDLAERFWQACKTQGVSFEPLGVAQGWSPGTYAECVRQLQAIGYDYIAVGGLAFHHWKDISACLAAIAKVRSPGTRLHMLGGVRANVAREYARYGVVSFDSAGPLRHALKDARDNYFAPQRTYAAIRVPQARTNVTLQKEVRAGRLSLERVQRLEGAALRAVRAIDQEGLTAEEALPAILEYEALLGSGRSYGPLYLETLREKPWQACPCEICRSVGYHVILLRGSERSRRRGFHNVWQFNQSMRAALSNQSGAALLEARA